MPSRQLSSPMPSNPTANSASSAKPASTVKPPLSADRFAALAAAEARLRGEPSNSETDPGTALKPKEEVWTGPDEKIDRETRLKFGRLIDRGIVRDNGYRQSAEAVETLSKIASNILGSPREAKYRTLKATNAALQNKVLTVKGGHDYLIALGFRTETVDFSQQYVLAPTLKRMHELKLGAEILDAHVEDLRKRASSLSFSTAAQLSDEAERKARALREIEADRSLVKARIERERIVREAREQAARKREAAEKEAERQTMAEEDEGNEDGDGGKTATAGGPRMRSDTVAGEGGATDDEEEEVEFRGFSGKGQRLG